MLKKFRVSAHVAHVARTVAVGVEARERRAEDRVADARVRQAAQQAAMLRTVQRYLDLAVARGEAVAQMKADGIEYEERMELLESVTHPEPLAELLRAVPRLHCPGEIAGFRWWLGETGEKPTGAVEAALVRQAEKLK